MTKYPVVNPDPSVDDCMKSMRIEDWLTLGGVTAGSWFYGYVAGAPVRTISAATSATIGFTFASFVCLQNNRARFLGLRENAREIREYGDYKFPVMQKVERQYQTAKLLDTINRGLEYGQERETEKVEDK
mmetsp:Transcript_36594/g.41754  ORF Transcript_36594/g.41754 Transcript_36594/m.41754 type:complete len:130 (-) Transcript_36594:1094-1483(-)